MRRRRNYHSIKFIVSLAAVATIAVIGGTFAYFNQELSASNEFLTGKYDTDIHEEFIPPSDWQPGVEIPKNVKIKNNGNVDVVAAAKLTESCIRKEDVYITGYTTKDGKMVEEQIKVADKGEILPLRVEMSDGTVEEVAWKDFGSSETVVPFDPEALLKTYQDKWVYLYDEENQTYYFLYMGIIRGKKESPPLLEHVTLNPKLQSVARSTKLVADTDENGENRYTFSYDKNAYGYDSVNYRLNVEAKTVQATKDAVDSVLGSNRELIPEAFDGLLEALKAQCKDSQLIK